jgi:Ca2+-binding RTX toxin-like protein
LALAFTGAVACGQSNQAKPIDFNANGFEGFESTQLDLLSAACTFPSGNMSITLGVNETGYLFKRASDGMVVANAATAGGGECAILASALTGATGKKIIVKGLGTAQSPINGQKLIIDYMNGLFGVATVASTFPTTDNTMIQVDLGVGTGHNVKFRGTPNADNFLLGTTSGVSYLGVATGTTTTATVAARTMADVSIQNASDIVVSAGPGNDVISGLGFSSTATAAPNALAGTINFTVYGGDDNDIITSGAASSGGAANSLYGNDGNDKFVQQVACAKDLIDGGNGADVVDYSAKTGGVNVSLASVVVPAVAATGSITCVAASSIVNNQKFTLDDGAGHSKVFEFQAQADLPATGSITILDHLKIAEGDEFTLSDGTLSKTFMFDKGNATLGTDEQVLITGLTVESDIADAIRTAVGLTALGLTTDAPGSAIVNFTNSAPGSANNVAISGTGCILDATATTVVGMTGGTTYAATGTDIQLNVIGLADTAVATFVQSHIASNIGNVTITAGATGGTTIIPLTFNSVGVAGNLATVSKTPGATFLVSGLSGGADVGQVPENDGDPTCPGGGEKDSILATVEHVVGTNFADTLDASLATGVAHILVGLSGDDILIGADATDYLFGGMGNDTLTGGGTAKDYLYGGDGNDTLISNKLADHVIDGGNINCPVAATLFTGYAPGGSAYVLATTCTAATATSNGVDTLDFSNRLGNEPVTCSLSVAAGPAVICGDVTGSQHIQWANIRNLRGGAGNDNLTGDNNDNAIWGGAGNDTIIGMGGNDTLYGEAGNDTIYGGNQAGTLIAVPASSPVTYYSENDYISGGAGTNFLYGGVGGDLIDSASATDTVDCGGQQADLAVSVNGATVAHCNGAP